VPAARLEDQPDYPGAILPRIIAQAEWLDDAACKDTATPNDFFVEGTSTDREALGSPGLLRAYELCAGCSVRRPCLNAAIEMNSVGVLAGTSEADRRAVEHLPRDVAISTLEAGLDDRLRLRRAAQLLARRANGRGDEPN
jgi:Transcription factor WhiB